MLQKTEIGAIAASLAQIIYGDFNQQKAATYDFELLLPEVHLPKKKDFEKAIITEHRRLIGVSEINGKLRFVQHIRSLPSFGTSFFICKELTKTKAKPSPICIAVNRSSVQRRDAAKTDLVLQEFPISKILNTNVTETSITFDLGPTTEMYQALTPEGATIASFVNGYAKFLASRQADRPVTLVMDQQRDLKQSTPTVKETFVQLPSESVTLRQATAQVMNDAPTNNDTFKVMVTTDTFDKSSFAPSVADTFQVIANANSFVAATTPTLADPAGKLLVKPQNLEVISMDDLEVLSVLGEGGFGVVNLALVCNHMLCLIPQLLMS